MAAHAGQAVLGNYRSFLNCLAEHSLRCGVGGPDVPASDVLEAGPSSRDDACLKSRVCSGVKQVRKRKCYAMDRKCRPMGML